MTGSPHTGHETIKGPALHLPNRLTPRPGQKQTRAWRDTWLAQSMPHSSFTDSASVMPERWSLALVATVVEPTWMRMP
jgi:hypothetical protein